jgi:tRNA (guanine37-N1)-methyltransferase
MRFDIVTIFPEFFGGPLDYGIVRRAREARLIEVCIHDLRDFTHDRHRTVDDRPFGGGEGMVMKPEPLFDAVETLVKRGHEAGAATAPADMAIVLLSASGKLFQQETARRFAKLKRIMLICGRYEGVDERVAEHLATDELSIGDFVLSGGELPAAMIVEAVTRLIPGALGNEDSTVNESFSEPVAAADGAQQAAPLQSRGAARGILDYPHYTRPQSFRGWDVPEVLMSGNHEDIRRWRREKALEKTRRNRPDLLGLPDE